MSELQQLSIVPDGTPEQARAMGLHYEIVNAAQAAAESLLALGRKLKQMRDTAGYKHLGFASFADYTEAAVGIRQRQAYNYINLVERVPARLIEENAAAGVTKLALLGSLAPADQAEVARDTDLANITVAELKKLIEEKNGLSEQLSLLQEQPVEAAAEEIDLAAIRRDAAAQARAEEQAAAEKKIQSVQAAADAARVEALRLAHQAAEESTKAAVQAERNKAKHEAQQQQKELDRLKDKLRNMENAGKKELERQIQAAREQAASEARAAQEQTDAAQLEQARRAAERAEKSMKELKMQADPDSTRFVMLFEQLQQKAHDLMELSDHMAQNGSREKADQLCTALAGALKILSEQAAQQTNRETGKGE